MMSGTNERDTNGRLPGGREAVIVRASLIGIGTNLALAAGKAVAGLMARSIAMVLDAVNNLSDALSSLITIIATRLAGRAPDKHHPLGHGRIEYLSALIIAGIVLYAGIAALLESVRKIISPVTPEYSALSLIVLGVAVAAKLFLGYYFRRVGRETDSGSLRASGTDALSDAFLSASVLAGAVVYMTSGLNLEAWIGVLISCFILRAGIGLMKEAVDDLLGKRLDPEITAAIRQTILAEEPVSGVFDLILNSYGPERMIGSAHIEVPDTMTAAAIDRLERRIASRVLEKHGVLMTAIGIYAKNSTDDRIAEMRSRLTRMVMSHDGILQVHGFSVNEEEKTILFDVIVDYDRADRRAIFEHISREAAEMYPDYDFRLVMDIDI